ncbi:MAG: hypothetical protein HYR51_11995 [Candidatus Rokubacteria bacterium]|nr:hypothetical protein [Candidatus Rokubacteria bacterium]
MQRLVFVCRHGSAKSVLAADGFAVGALRPRPVADVDLRGAAAVATLPPGC